MVFVVVVFVAVVAMAMAMAVAVAVAAAATTAVTIVSPPQLAVGLSMPSQFSYQHHDIVLRCLPSTASQEHPPPWLHHLHQSMCTRVSYVSG